MNVLIKDIALDEKPRERFLLYGKENISNEELIAIILRCGTRNSSAKTLASFILKEFKNINELKNASVNNLTQIKGVGSSKAISLLAAMELGRRVYFVKNKKSVVFNTAEKVYEYFKSEFINEKQEKFCCLFLDTKCKLISFKTIFVGSVNVSTVHPREMFKEAFLVSASSIICIHNHPSGDVSPSKADVDLTKRLEKIGELIGIKIMDHIILSDNSFYSFYEKENNK